MARWECIVCGLIYDEKEGWPDDGIAPGTKWQDVPEDWSCPDCGVGKDDFELIPGSEDGASESTDATANSGREAQSRHVVVIGSGPRSPERPGPCARRRRVLEAQPAQPSYVLDNARQRFRRCAGEGASVPLS